MTGPLTKLVVARAQLVTALDLFIRDKDPISVHCLACGGGGVIEAIAVQQSQQTFATYLIATQPDMDRYRVRRARNQYWNAFKHFSDKQGLARDDEELLARFDDQQNDAALFIGWWTISHSRRSCRSRRRFFRSGGTL